MGAFEQAKRLSLDRGARARELAAQGVKTIGYFCAFPPVELITAAGLMPFRITGSPEPRLGGAAADECLETQMCPFVRSAFDLARQGRFNFLAGMVWPHSCDNVQKTFDVWKHYLPAPLFHYLDVPHMTDPSSFEFFTAELHNLKTALEHFTGAPITAAALAAAIAEHNRLRGLLRELSALRKPDPPLLFAAEMMEVMLAVMSLPVIEAIALVSEAIAEARTRESRLAPNRPRLLVYGSELDNPALFDQLEQAGAHVVIEDLCVGSKTWLHDVNISRTDIPVGPPTMDDLLAGLADYYLDRITCPRTFHSSAGTGRNLDVRFQYLRDLARDYRVSGAVLYVLMYCDTFEFDVPDVKDYLEAAGVPCLHLEDDYRLSNQEAIKTRIEAFLEVIEK